MRHLGTIRKATLEAMRFWGHLFGRDDSSQTVGGDPFNTNMFSEQQIPRITRPENSGLLTALPNEIGARKFARLRPQIIRWYLHHRRFDGVTSATCTAHALVWSMDAAARTVFTPEEVEVLARAHQDFSGAQDMLIGLNVLKRRRLKPPFKRFDSEILAGICASLVATVTLPVEQSPELSQSFAKIPEQRRGFLNALLVAQRLHLLGQMLMGLWDPDFARAVIRRAIQLLDPRGLEGIAAGKEAFDFVDLAYCSRTHEAGGDTISIDLIGESSGHLVRAANDPSRHTTVAAIGAVMNYQRAFFLARARYAVRTYGLADQTIPTPASEEDPLTDPFALR